MAAFGIFPNILVTYIVLSTLSLCDSNKIDYANMTVPMHPAIGSSRIVDL